MEEIITSRENAQIKRVAALLHRKKEREASGCFVTEGLRLSIDAMQSGIPIRTVLLTKTAHSRYPQTELLLQSARNIFWMTDDLADKLGDTNTTQGVFAICERLDIAQCAVTIKRSGHYLLADGVQDPGNLGTMLRTADALGMDGVWIGKGSPDLYSPKVLRSAMGGVFRVPHCVGDIGQAMDTLKAEGVPLYAAALTEQADRAGTIDFTAGGAVLIGNEGNGLSAERIAACDGSIIIPMCKASNSLNAAIAAAILMWEMKRR